MILFVSFTRLKETEEWFWHCIKRESEEKFGGILSVGPSSVTLNKDKNIDISWDIAKTVSTWDKWLTDNQIAADETDVKWVYRALALKGQSADLYNSPLYHIQKYREVCRRIINDIKPNGVISLNPKAPQMGIFCEVATDLGVPIIYFERAVFKDSFEFDRFGVGPFSSTVLNPKKDIKVDYDKSRCSLQFNNSRPNSRFEKIGQCSSETKIGLLGLDDSTLGLAYPTDEKIHNFWSGSFEAAVSIAEETVYSVLFKPHPSSVHLVDGAKRPENLVLFLGSLEKYFETVDLYIGFGSTSDYIGLHKGIPYILAGKSALSGSGLVSEPEGFKELIDLLNHPKEIVKSDVSKIKCYLDEVYSDTVASKCKTGNISNAMNLFLASKEITNDVLTVKSIPYLKRSKSNIYSAIRKIAAKLKCRVKKV